MNYSIFKILKNHKKKMQEFGPQGIILKITVFVYNIKKI